jgi:IclR family pca regulon transcriptional regulator
MGRSTTHRYVITLVALGYLEQDRSRKYRLGSKVTDLGMAALNATGLAEHARAYLEELRDRSSFTASLAVLDGIDVVYVVRAQSFRRRLHELDPRVAAGTRLPAHCTALGKVLLAFLPDGEREQRLRGVRLASRGPNTITSKRKLHVELMRVREDRLAVCEEELAPGSQAIAVPVRGATGEVLAAVNLVSDSAVISLPEFVEHMTAHLITAADQVSARLGYRRDADQAAAA